LLKFQKTQRASTENRLKCRLRQGLNIVLPLLTGGGMAMAEKRSYSPGNTIKKTLKAPDWWILFAALLLVCLGIIMVFSSSQYFTQFKYGDSYYYLKRQMLNAAVGLVFMTVAYFLNYHWYRSLSVFFYAGTVLMMIALLFIGTENRGAVRWIDLGFITFQPSELAKVTMVMFMSALLASGQKFIRGFKKGFLPTLAVLAFTCAMVYLQNDLGTAVVIAGAGLIMMFCGRVRLGYLVITGFLGCALAAGAVLFTEFRMDRIYAYLNPWADPQGAGFQTVQSLLAIGSGGLTGVGLGSAGSAWYYLPEQYTDFIFSVLAEELGFIGGLLVILLFIFLIWRGFMTAVNAPDVFGAMLALGLTSVLGLQAFINIGVVTGLLPITGITLPFLSYGGTSLVMSMGMVGILLNISRHAEIRR
jgi:cell division protein FtsW